MSSRLAVWMATAFGAGYAPFASGTFGAAVGVLLYLATAGLSPQARVAFVVALSAVGVWASSVAARHFDREDPGQVVIDEVAGQLLTYGLFDLSWSGLLIGFVLFRIFDIVKPWPARRMEDWPGGWGVMADDLMAGVYAWLVLAGLIAWAPALA
jgi:phosphatidylglycerophosphatase A